MKSTASSRKMHYPAQAHMPATAGHPMPIATGRISATGYPGYPYYPSTMPPPPQQFVQPNVLASQFPPMQTQIAVPPHVATPTQIPASIQQMAAPFQPGIAPPPLIDPHSSSISGQQQNLTGEQITGGAMQPPVSAGNSTPRPPVAVDSERPTSAAAGGAGAAAAAAASAGGGASGAAGLAGHGPAGHQGGAGGEDDPFDDQYDHRCSLCIAAWGFAFLCGLTGAAGVLFVHQGHTVSFKTLGIVLLSVSVLLFLSTFLFLPASSKYSNKMPVHRQCLPFLLAVITSGEICWVVYLINEGASDGKGLLVALAAFLALFWLALWKIMCLRCCCHRRRICAQKKAQARLEQHQQQQQQTSKRRAGGKRNTTTDPEEFETDFHHVNTQVRETLRNRFNESILQQTIIQSAAPSMGIRGGEGPTLAIVSGEPQSQASHVPSAPPADSSTHGVNNTGTLTTFGVSQGTSSAVASSSTVGQPSGQASGPVHDPPPYDAVYRRTPPPPYSTLV